MAYPRGLLDMILGGQQNALGNPLDDGTPAGLLGSGSFAPKGPQGLLGPEMGAGPVLDDPRVGYGQMLARPDAMAQRPTLETKVGGVTDSILGSGLDGAALGAGTDTLKNARRQALLGFGTTLLGAGARQARRPNIGQAVGAALQAGQQGYAGAVDTAGKVQAQKKAQELETNRRAIYDKYAGKITDPDSLGQMMSELAAVGDTAGLGPLSNVYNAMSAADAAAGKGKLHWVTDEYGGYAIGTDEKTGEVRVKIPIGAKAQTGAGAGMTAAEQRQEKRLILQARNNIEADFTRDTQNDRTLLAQVQPVIEPLKAALKTGVVNGPLQVAAIFKFINGLDNTAAREGEVAFAARAAGWRDQLHQAVAAAKGGPAKLPPQLLQDMTDMMDQRYMQAQQRVRYNQQKYTQRYKDEVGEDPNTMFFGVGNIGDEPAPAAAAADGGGSKMAALTAGMAPDPAEAPAPGGAARLQSLMTPTPTVTPPPPGLNKLFKIPIPRSDTYPMSR